ncbi:MAG: glycoside hydrolase family 25 protein [Ruminococcus sp.]|jgi:GH25 family lysozyme M1 (1,4-beta-N-acetylmuramidase)|nr:glycoside hydrolase family 25 protein [Ruminococcus sp.]
MEKLLIDVSHHNGNIDFAKVKADSAGIDGVIIRAGFGRYVSQKDKRFDKNVTGALDAGMDIGAYWYSYATNKNEALLEAKACVKIIAGKKFSYPIYFDIEDKCQLYLSKECCSEMVKTFCDYLELKGFFAGVYSYDSFFASNLSEDIPKRYSAWVARINSSGKEVIKPSHCKAYAMHQYSWCGKVEGIKGDVDMNLCFKNFPAIMKTKKLNGF